MKKIVLEYPSQLCEIVKPKSHSSFSFINRKENKEIEVKISYLRKSKKYKVNFCEDIYENEKRTIDWIILYLISQNFEFKVKKEPYTIEYLEELKRKDKEKKYKIKKDINKIEKLILKKTGLDFIDKGYMNEYSYYIDITNFKVWPSIIDLWRGNTILMSFKDYPNRLEEVKDWENKEKIIIKSVDWKDFNFSIYKVKALLLELLENYNNENIKKISSIKKNIELEGITSNNKKYILETLLAFYEAKKLNRIYVYKN